MNLNGLSNQEAQERLKKFGENKLKEKRENKAVKIFLSQFKSPLIYILVIASTVTLVLGDVIDAAVIGAAVVLNTVLGFYQEMKAEKGVRALSRILTPKAKVIRDGQQQIIEASQVVVGDICVLEIGEKVAADGVIMESENLSLNEAILTGESVAVAKKAEDEAYAGTIIASGIGKMLVKKTGPSTALGMIAESLKELKEEKTPLQTQLDNLARKLAIMVGVICAIIFAAGLWRGDSFITMFTTSVAVAVSAIPEGLVIALTVILALGMQRIFKQKALVRKLIAAETLGGVTVICCDKTGTLTEGKMTVVKALTTKIPNFQFPLRLRSGQAIFNEFSNSNEQKLAMAAILCNDMRDPLEVAMYTWATSKFPISNFQFSKKSKRLDSIPFSHENKYIATLHSNLLLVSGAPEALLDKCNASNKKIILEQFEIEAKKGHRLVGFAYRKFPISNNQFTIKENDIKDLTWLGALVFDDPVREGAKEALMTAREAGISVKMITGDYKATAEAVGKQLGIAPRDVYSRMTSEQKLKIVEELQAKGEVVAMTGDGVNDAPALKKADIGIVVAGASAVSREIADMVLMDSNFKTILAAVDEGRNIFINLKKVVFYLLSHVFTEVGVVIFCLILKLPLALTAGQILWINLVNDTWPSFALTLEPKTKEMIKMRRGEQKKLLDKKTKLLIVMISGLTAVISVGLFAVYLNMGKNLLLARSMVFTFVGLAPLFSSFSVRTFDKFILKEKLWQNPWLVLGGGLGMGFQAAALYIPGLQTVLKTTALGGKDWLIIGGLSLSLVGLIELVKFKLNKK